MTKDELRKQIKEEIKKLSAAERDTQSLYVCLQVIGSAEWQQAETVLLYAALPDEVNLQLLIDDAMGSGKKVILPVVDGDTLRLRKYDPQQTTTQGKFHIEEPTEACEELTNLTSIDLAVEHLAEKDIVWDAARATTTSCCPHWIARSGAYASPVSCNGWFPATNGT